MFNSAVISVVLAWCMGFIYRGICLEWVSANANVSAPTTCDVYQPPIHWTRYDFTVLCTFISGSLAACERLYTTSNAGRCFNDEAILAYDFGLRPDLWLNGITFSWIPNRNAPADCQIVSDPLGIVVYACQEPNSTVEIPIVSTLHAVLW